jgi:hypothetical protein
MTSELFFDTDCLSAFLWINNTSILEVLYPNRIVLPEPVYVELSNPRVPQLKRRVDSLIETNMASVREIMLDTEEYSLYRTLLKGIPGQRGIGRGEAASIALTKIHNGILASNNYSYIVIYIKKYDLQHTDTGNILLEALRRSIITEDEGNLIWQDMLAKKRKLPAVDFTTYLKNISP